MNQTLFTPQIEWRDPKVLKPYDNNAKAHPVEQIKKIATAIKDGFDQPIVIDEFDVILKGHGRREASLLLNLGQVPVVVRRGLTDEQKRMIRVSDNKLAESDWLFGNLALEFEAIDLAGLDVELTGFSQSEVDEILMANRLVEAEEADTQESQRRIAKKSGAVKVVLVADQIAIVEQAIRKAGIPNRGEAFTKICQFYLNNGQTTAEGQFDFLSEDPFAPISSKPD
jgi:ParB-like chromosome segregation protein Spo0J